MIHATTPAVSNWDWKTLGDVLTQCETNAEKV